MDKAPTVLPNKNTKMYVAIYFPFFFATGVGLFGPLLIGRARFLEPCDIFLPFQRLAISLLPFQNGEDLDQQLFNFLQLVNSSCISHLPSSFFSAVIALEDNTTSFTIHTAIRDRPASIKRAGIVSTKSIATDRLPKLYRKVTVNLDAMRAKLVQIEQPGSNKRRQH